jgi:hypothetical protein
VDSKLRDLLQAALDKTNSGAVEWTAFNSESFRARVGAGHLHIQRGSIPVETDERDRYWVTTYAVQVSDAQGRIVAEADAREGTESFALFDRLFDTARKTALGSDRVIEEMLHTLRGGVPA